MPNRKHGNIAFGEWFKKTGVKVVETREYAPVRIFVSWPAPGVGQHYHFWAFHGLRFGVLLLRPFLCPVAVAIPLNNKTGVQGAFA